VSYSERVAIVTGGASGIGHATVCKLAAHGAAVVVADINVGAAQAVCAEILDGGGKATAFEIAQTVAMYGRLDLLHNNAALLSPAIYAKDADITELSVDTLDQVFDVNLKSMFLTCKYGIPVMRESGGGAIINMASISALFGDDRQAAYGASKGAVITFTRYIATMYGPDNIRCNSVSPGMSMSPATMAVLSERDRDVYASERLLPEPTTPDDVANLVVFLGSEFARCITGQNIVVDNGQSAHRSAYSVRRVMQ
jgi:NAD(P)-dependent dehydrogenase (short-subunit alcohol dehydrogenase family)